MANRRHVRATSVDVDELAGVSQSAVSRAFTPGSSIKASTRAKVIDAAGKLNYVPNSIASSLASRHGHAFADPALYLPKAWTSDPARMKASHTPDGTAFATKPALDLRMIH
jgi:Bacterial regulatory proteins, lacI family